MGDEMGGELARFCGLYRIMSEEVAECLHFKRKLSESFQDETGTMQLKQCGKWNNRP
jgi:hypothetical protein